MILAKVYQVQGGEAFNAKDFAAAAAVFEKGYAANPRNTDMALNLATSYCELGKFDEGMAICVMPVSKLSTPVCVRPPSRSLLLLSTRTSMLSVCPCCPAHTTICSPLLSTC